MNLYSRMFFVITFLTAAIAGVHCDREYAPLEPWLSGSGATQTLDRATGAIAGQEELIGKIGKRIAIEPGFIVQTAKCIWKNDRKAAYTISFDDTRNSHFEISGPELSKRSMAGTFSLNTKNVVNWTDWRQLAQAGHEIASHTHTHVKCTEVSESELRAELLRAKQEILQNIPQLLRVPSFTYPFGLFNDTTLAVVRDYHVSARAGWGINQSDLAPDELLTVKGIGVYPPYDLPAIHGRVVEAISTRGWVLVYFHSVSRDASSDAYTISFDKYVQHLDYIKSLSDSLWIATQGEVADYIRLRRGASIQPVVRDQNTIEVSLTGTPADLPADMRLSVKVWLPQTWRGRDLLVFDSQKGTTVTVRTELPYVIINLPPGGLVQINAING